MFTISKNVDSLECTWDDKVLYTFEPETLEYELTDLPSSRYHILAIVQDDVFEVCGIDGDKLVVRPFNLH